MTTAMMFPLHSHSFRESASYAQAISEMSTGPERFFNGFNPTATPEPTSYDLSALQPQSLGPVPGHSWSMSHWSSVPPQTTPIPSTNNIPASTADINPAALTAPSFTPANRPAPYYDSTASTSPCKSHFDTSSSASPVNLPIQPRRDSLYPRDDDASKHCISSSTIMATTSSSASTIRRRRNSEYVEPGSARAIYLEKNRRAASKCRSKQKYEQEQLVERSRLFERRNRLLKAERDLLQAEVRSLKDLLGQHTHCPDQRIAQYLQLEANRLAATHEYLQQY